MPTPFEESVYALLRQVPAGKVTTYKALAEALGTKAYRAIGTALHKNPYAPEVPCHRVVTSTGFVGGFAHGTPQKIAMLQKEGITIDQNGYLDLSAYFFTVKP
ncbi:MGMT family protein [Candidatus Woesearchaeota archaeon]|nr:MGMT family protein [Candidatus Woesearchaeota archaeon]